MKHLIIVIAACVLALGLAAHAQVPGKLSYQGLLTTSAGTPVQDGNYTLRFEIFTLAAGGTALWSEDHPSVQLQRGTFALYLGSVTALTLPFGQPYFVQVTALAGPGIASPVAFVPRTELASSPYALRADTALYALAAPPGGAAGGDLTGTYPNPTIAADAVTTAKILNNTIQREDVATDFKAPLADTADYARTALGVIDSARVAANAHALQGKDTTALSSKFIDEGQTAGGGLTGTYPDPAIADDAVTTAKILNNTIRREDVATDFKAPYADTADYAASALPGGNAGGDLTGTYPNPTIAIDAVTSAKIFNNTITNADISPSAGIADTKLSGTGSVVLNFNADLLDGMQASSFAPTSHSHNYLPLAGGTMTGAINSSGNPSITMGKGNFGSGNLNPGTDAFVVGSNNRARGPYSVVGGGGGSTVADSNSAVGDYSTIAGGARNIAQWSFATVGGGRLNSASNSFAAIGGGHNNTASGDVSTVGGGYFNTASGARSVVSGGGNNIARGDYSTIGGGGGATGDSNSAIGNQSTIAGGLRNKASGHTSAIGGGYENTTSGNNSVVAGGYLNLATGQAASVVGGQSNTAGGDYSFAAGRRAKANHNGVFVWGDATDADFTSTSSNQFLIRANSGVGINTASTPYPLTVNGMIYSMTGGYRFPDGSVQTTAVGTGTYLPLAGGTMTGAINSSGNPSITMGKGNFGSGNTNAGTWAFVAGMSSSAAGDYSFAAGRRAKANSLGSFVWADAQDADFTASSSNQFLIRASSGVGINTTSTPSPLTVAGMIYSTSGGYRFPDGTVQTTAVGAGTYLPLAGGTMTGAITNTGNPYITMGKGNFGSGNLNPGTDAFVAGTNNRARGAYSVVSGGGGTVLQDSNSAIGQYSTVSGGRHNTATAAHSTVGGGSNNSASGSGHSTIGGGDANSASSPFATIGGGYNNAASGELATVGGGYGNIASVRSTVAGGSNNRARGAYSFVGGGGGQFASDSNSASGNNSVVCGGTENEAGNHSATVGGGSFNTASGEKATVAGGSSNTASGFAATTSGGYTNTASGPYSAVPGGLSNEATARFSFAAGRRAKANHDGAFVWSDSTNADFASTAQNQFLIRASGGVGIGTTSPQGALDVTSTTGAFIVPRMTTTQRDALAAVNGMIIYNTTTNQFNFRENDAWVTK